jgi:mono/diheme cytochrome c family protein
VIQSGLVYSDDTDILLSANAVEGRKLFHEGSCQVCHQLWGQGGFLGPDLTNASSRVDDTRLASLLTMGSGQMPAYAYADREIQYIRSFLEEIDRPDLGRGQLRLGDPSTSVTPQAAFDAVVRATASGDELEGAPDLSTVTERLDVEDLIEVLKKGRPERGMPLPSPVLSDEQVDDLVKYLDWLYQNRSALLAEWGDLQAGRGIDWRKLDWWEFR